MNTSIWNVAGKLWHLIWCLSPFAPSFPISQNKWVFRAPENIFRIQPGPREVREALRGFQSSGQFFPTWPKEHPGCYEKQLLPDASDSNSILSGSMGIAYHPHKILYSICCPQIVNIINKMSCIAFSFPQKIWCLYFLSHHKYVILFASQYWYLLLPLY